MHKMLPQKVRAGEELEVQLAPFGDWPNHDSKGNTIMQHVTPEAAGRLAANFETEILVDLDHNSIGGGTEAAAWVTDLRADPEQGLVGTFRFTDLGADAVTNRRYRFVSVAWTLDDNGEPSSIDSVALTNRPNLPVRPILNSRLSPACGGSAEPKKEIKNMEKLIELLGLSPDATEEDVIAAVTELRSRRDELETAAANAEAEEFAEENGDLVKDKCQLKNAYLANKELAKAMIANCRKPAHRAPVTAANAKRPDITDLRSKLASLPPSKRADFYRQHKADFDL